MSALPSIHALTASVIFFTGYLVVLGIKIDSLLGSSSFSTVYLKGSHRHSFENLFILSFPNGLPQNRSGSGMFTAATKALTSARCKSAKAGSNRIRQ